MDLRLTTCAVVGLASLTSGSALAQSSALYVTDGDSQRLAIAQNGNATIKTTYVRGYPIVVRNTVWIGDYSASIPAREYDLAGNATGNTSAYTARNAVDAGTDGVNNYMLGNAFSGNATVWRTDGQFGNQVALFSVQGSDLVGITYDMNSNTLWISDNTNIYNYTTGGQLLSSFAHGRGRGCLAWEPSTDTLWYVNNGSNNIHQFTKTGTFLQTVVMNGLTSNNWGAEFQMAIPAPGALAMLGLAGLVSARRRRR